MKSVGTRTIETERLILRRFERSDAKSMMNNWISDEKVQSEYGEPAYKTEVEVLELLNKYLSQYADDNYYRWAIIEKVSGEVIGQIAFYLVYLRNHFAEIEYCIGAGHQRKGYATEATKAVIQYGFEMIGLHKIQICARTANIKSLGVIKKCGFTYEGTLRDYFYMQDHYEGKMYYSLLREEWIKKDRDNGGGAYENNKRAL